MFCLYFLAFPCLRYFGCSVLERLSNLVVAFLGHEHGFIICIDLGSELLDIQGLWPDVAKVNSRHPWVRNEIVPSFPIQGSRSKTWTLRTEKHGQNSWPFTEQLPPRKSRRTCESWCRVANIGQRFEESRVWYPAPARPCVLTRTLPGPRSTSQNKTRPARCPECWMLTSSSSIIEKKR